MIHGARVRFSRVLTVLLCVLSLHPGTDVAEAGSSRPGPDGRTWQDEIVYFIMIDRFNNGDRTNDYDMEPANQKGYHGGDLQGIIDKLDYIQEIGATAIWLTPVVQNQTGGYHGYWATDFYQVDKHWGDLAKLKELVDRAHSRGIKVLLDVVVNHTAPTHPWISDPGRDSWFHHEGGINNWDDQAEIENGSLAGLPDLAQENPAVADYLIEMSKWWISQTGVDGFRLDTVRHVPRWFWERYTSEIRRAFPGFFFLGEVWSEDPAYLASYQGVGIDALTNFPLYYKIKASFGTGNGTYQLATLAEALDAAMPNSGLMGNFIDNHDVPRFISDNAPGGADKLKLALAYLLTSKGIPIIYYGTEVGMEGGGDPDNRRDMKWDGDRELLGYFKTLTMLRQAEPALRRGSTVWLNPEPNVLAYLRLDGDSRVLVVLNNSEEEKSVSLALPQDAGLNGRMHLRNALGQDQYKVKGATVQVPLQAREAKILLPAPARGVPWAGTAAAAVLLTAGAVLWRRSRA